MVGNFRYLKYLHVRNSTKTTRKMRYYTEMQNFSVDIIFSTLKAVISFPHACGTKKRDRERQALLSGVPEHGHGRARPQWMFPSGKELDSIHKFLIDIKIPALWLVRLLDLGTRPPYLTHKSVTEACLLFSEKKPQKKFTYSYSPNREAGSNGSYIL